MKQKSNLHLIEGIIALILIGGLIWFVLYSRNASAPSDNFGNQQTGQEPAVPATATPPTGTPASNKLDSTDSVAVSTQSNNSKMVYIDNVNLSKPGFVVVVIPGTAGKLDQVLGTSKLLTAGEKQDLQISLTNGQILDSSIDYTVLLYQDNGDKKFNIKTDTLLTGKSSSATFIAK